MQENSKIGILKVLLTIFSVVILLILIISIYSAILYGDFKDQINPIFHAFYFILLFGSYLIIIQLLKKILNTISNGDPFLNDNVIHFKKIGYLVFLIGFIDAIRKYPIPNNTGIEFLSTPYGSLKPGFFLYLVLSCLAFILADVFRMAIEIKNDNNLTI